MFYFRKRHSTPILELILELMCSVTTTTLW